MSYQPETPSYDAGVYQLQATDPVDGGPGAVSNAPLLNLANRTNWLYTTLNAVISGATVPDGLALINSQAFTGTPSSPTPALGDSSTKISNTAFVQGTVSGLASINVAGAANVTLTPVQAGNGILVFTGALTANIAVIVPNASKSMVVENLTTGAFTLTVKTAAGTGIAVTQGKTQELICDGTNVLLSSSDFVNLALTGLPTAPTAAPGTNTTQVCTTAFVTAAVAAVTTGYAPINSPPLTGTPTAPTPPQFDSSTKLATMGALRQFGMQASAFTQITGNTTLTASAFGSSINNTSTGAATWTLPASTVAVPGARIEIVNFTAYSLTIASAPGEAVVRSGASSVTSFTLLPGDTVVLEVSIGTTWLAVGGTWQLGQAGGFGSSLAASGYQKLPSGLIIQWGVATLGAGTSTGSVIFPLAFPTACRSVTATDGGSAGWAWGANPSSAGAFTLNKPPFYGTSTSANTAASTSGTAFWIAIGY